MGWDNVHQINDDFSEVQIQVFDLSDRMHILTLKLPPDFPDEKPTALSSLPQAFEFLWASSGSSIRNIRDQFKAALNQYQEYWNQVDELKFKTWILEPENPNYGATSFIIAVGNYINFHVPGRQF